MARYYYEPSKGHGLPHDPLNAIVAPRPIGWIGTRSRAGQVNQFKRRFWETDDDIFGGISYTDQTIGQIGYPSTGFFSGGKGVVLGAYTFGPDASVLTSLSPAERIALAVEQGSKVHPQYKAEYDTGATVAWHRVPWTLGCAGNWSEEARTDHFADMCSIDGRIVLAGEHASYIPAWQEGAVTSALDAIGRLHKQIVAG